MEGKQAAPETPKIDDADPEIDKLCATIVSKIRSIRDLLEDYNMLPSSSGAEPGRSSRRGSGSGMSYLKPEDLTKTPQEAKVLAVKLDTENQYGTRVVLKLSLAGQVKFWGVNIKKNPNYSLLEQSFGRDENDWAGKKILLGLELDDFTDTFQIRVSFPAGETTARRR